MHRGGSKRDTPVRLGNVRVSVLSTSTGFALDVIKQISEPVRYSQEYAVGLSMTLQLDITNSTLSLIYREHMQ